MTQKLSDVAETVNMDDSETETTVAPALSEQEITIRAYGVALVKHLPTGWTFNYNARMERGELTPPDEATPFFVIYPAPRDSMRIMPNADDAPVPAITARYATRAVAVRIATELYPPLLERVTAFRAAQARAAAIKQRCTEILTQLAATCEHSATEVDTWLHPRLDITRPLSEMRPGVELDTAPGSEEFGEPVAREWNARLYVHNGEGAGDLIGISLDDLTIAQAEAVLRALSL